MFKLKKLILSFLPLAIIILVSCEGSTDREWGATNESSAIIEVKVVLVGQSDTLVQTIEPWQSKIITLTQEDKGISEAQQPYEVFSHFAVTKADTIVADLDWSDIHSWEIFIEQTKSNPPQFMQEYYIIVKNADF
jgi:hypothetical protein